MPFLLVVSGPNEGDYHPLKGRTVTVGRDEECTIQIVDGLVSRRHLKVLYDEKSRRYRAFDDHSANGVFVNDKQMTGESPLCDGDIIRIGDSELIFSERDFVDRETALEHYGRRPEQGRRTIIR